MDKSSGFQPGVILPQRTQLAMSGGIFVCQNKVGAKWVEAKKAAKQSIHNAQEAQTHPTNTRNKDLSSPKCLQY